MAQDDQESLYEHQDRMRKEKQWIESANRSRSGGGSGSGSGGGCATSIIFILVTIGIVCAIMYGH